MKWRLGCLMRGISSCEVRKGSRSAAVVVLVAVRRSVWEDAVRTELDKTESK